MTTYAHALILVLALSPTLTHAATITVDTNSDVGGPTHCTLRDALVAANTNLASPSLAGSGCTAGDAPPVVDRVVFAIPGDGPHTIEPASMLPAIVEPVAIDGYTQSGAARNTKPTGPSHPPGNDAVLKIVLSGSRLSDDQPRGLRFRDGSGGSSVQGISFTGFRFNGICMLDCGSLPIQAQATSLDLSGNYFGVAPDGASRPNDAHVEAFGGGSLRIGSVDVGDVNLFGGGWSSVWAHDVDLTFSRNLVGFGRDGTAAPVMYGVEYSSNGSVGIYGNVIHGRDVAIVGSARGPYAHGIADNRLIHDTAPAIVLIGDAGRTDIRRNHNVGTHLAIDLAPILVRNSNDEEDLDGGPNGSTNHPTLKHARYAFGTIAVDYALDNAAGTTASASPLPMDPFAIEVHGSEACSEATGALAGGAEPLATGLEVDPKGSGTIVGHDAFPAPRYVAASVTGPEGTSEMSPCLAVFDDGVFTDAFEARASAD